MRSPPRVGHQLGNSRRVPGARALPEDVGITLGWHLPIRRVK
jgi:hypothetical protein